MARLAQSVEQPLRKRQVAGSMPVSSSGLSEDAQRGAQKKTRDSRERPARILRPQAETIPHSSSGNAAGRPASIESECETFVDSECSVVNPSCSGLEGSLPALAA